MKTIEADLTKLQEIYFDLCDLINTGIGKDVDLADHFEEFETLHDFLVEQRDKLEPYTHEDDTEGETGIISRMNEARHYDNQPPLRDGLDDDLMEPYEVCDDCDCGGYDCRDNKED